MKIAASIFSWLGAIITTLLDRRYMIQAETIISKNPTQYPPDLISILWGVFIVGVIIRFIILIWREVAVTKGKKVGCGICTLLFCSMIGGILTLCIPEDQLKL